MNTTEETDSLIMELACDLAEHEMTENFHVSPDQLYDDQGTYFEKYQDIFNDLYDKYFNLIGNNKQEAEV
jgi:hypothetical protein